MPHLFLKRSLVSFQRKEMISFRASLLSEPLSELLERFDLSHCSESKLFNTFEKLIIKITVPKLLMIKVQIREF